MKNLFFRFVVSAVVAVSVSACVGAPARLGSSSAAAPAQGTAREISGSSCGFQLLLFIPIAVNGRLAEANKELKAEAAGDYITNIRVEESWYYAFVGTGYCTTLKATAIRAGA